MSDERNAILTQLHRVRTNYGSRPCIDDSGAILTYDQFWAAVDAKLARSSGSCSPWWYVRTGLGAASYIDYVAGVLSGHPIVPLSHQWPTKRQKAVVSELEALGDDAFDTLVPKDCAYVLHTSGSTGRPKRVPITYANLYSFLNGVLSHGEVTAEDRLSATFDLAFDLAGYDLYATLLTGACLVLPKGNEFVLVSEYVARRQLTQWFSVPTVVTRAAALGRLRPESLNSLHRSLFCGEELTWTQVSLWAAAACHSDIINLYGPTELTLACTTYQLPRMLSDWPVNDVRSVPIGNPLPGAEVTIGSKRDSHELRVRGEQRFAGYLDISDNHGAFEGGAPNAKSSWYLTGDRVDRFKQNLTYLGRLDSQVKIGGMRVELGEVESACRRLPGVFAATARVENERLCVEIVGHPDKDIRETLASILPVYMLPHSIIEIDQPSVSASGKTIPQVRISK